MTKTLWEGDCVRHSTTRFIGMHVGFTRISSLMERSGDLRGVRVQLPDGTITIASEHNLEKVDVAEFKKLATASAARVKAESIAAANRV